jgi:hypothetical protein
MVAACIAAGALRLDYIAASEKAGTVPDAVLLERARGCSASALMRSQSRKQLLIDKISDNPIIIL